MKLANLEKDKKDKEKTLPNVQEKLDKAQSIKTQLIEDQNNLKLSIKALLN